VPVRLRRGVIPQAICLIEIPHPGVGGELICVGPPLHPMNENINPDQVKSACAAAVIIGIRNSLYPLRQVIYSFTGNPPTRR